MAGQRGKRASDVARDFFKTLKKGGEPAPMYLLFGEETFLLDLALRQTVRAVLPRGINDFNYDQFYGHEVIGDRVVSACETLALMGGRRLVLVKEIQNVSTAQLQPLANYLTNPSPMTTLLCHGQTTNKKINKNTKFFKQARKAGVVQEFAALREWEIGTFLKRQAATRKLQLTPEAEDALVKAVGTDLATLDTSLEKVDLYIGAAPEGHEGPRVVEADALHEVVATTRAHEIWDLTDAIARRDIGASLRLLGEMLEQGQSGVGINMMVARHFRQLWQVKTAAEQGLDKRGIASKVGMNPYFVERYRKAARRFKLDELRRIMQALLRTDRSLKSSRLRDQLILERMVIGVCTGEGLS